MPDVWTVISVLLVLAIFREGIEQLIAHAAPLVARPFLYMTESITNPGRDGLRTRINEVLDALSPKPSDGSAHPWRGWQVVRTLVYFALTLAILLAGGYVILLRLAALMQFDAPIVQEHGVVPILAALELGGALILNSLALFDPHMTEMGQDGRSQWLHTAATVGVCVTIGTSMLLFFWGQRAIQGADDWPIGLLIVTLLGLLTTLAGIVGHWALISIWPVLYAITMSIALGLLVSVGLAAWFSFRVVRTATSLMLTIVKALALPGHGLRQWITSFDWIDDVVHWHPGSDLWIYPEIDWDK